MEKIYYVNSSPCSGLEAIPEFTRGKQIKFDHGQINASIKLKCCVKKKALSLQSTDEEKTVFEFREARENTMLCLKFLS